MLLLTQEWYRLVNLADSESGRLRIALWTRTVLDLKVRALMGRGGFNKEGLPIDIAVKVQPRSFGRQGTDHPGLQLEVYRQELAISISFVP